MDGLLKLGLEGLPSGQPRGYYVAVLQSKDPAGVLLDQRFNYYQALEDQSPLAIDPTREFLALGQDGGDDEKENRTNGEVKSVAKKRRCFGGKKSASAAVPLQTRVCKTLVVESDTDSSDGLELDDGEGESSSTQFFVEGVQVYLETHLSPGENGHYRRYVVHCPVHWGVDGSKCRKRRNVGVEQCRAGDLAPVAFLGVWIKKARDFANKKLHVNFCPSDAEVVGYMKDNGMISGAC